MAKKPVEKDPAKDGKGQGPPKEKKGPGILLYIIVSLGAVLAGGLIMGAIIYFLGVPGVAPKTEKAEVKEDIVYETLELGDRVVNLADPGGMRFLKVKIVIEFEKNKKFAEELQEKNASIMESILRVLRTKTVNEIRPVEKEDKVKEEIINTINADLKNGKVEKIYFTDFLIQ